MNQIALIIHRIMDAPDHFRHGTIAPNNAEIISDGYHRIAMNGDFYCLGEAKMLSTDGERVQFCAAIKEWKRETGWGKDEIAKPTPAIPPYVEFVKTVRSHFRSYNVHMNPSTLANGIGEALAKLDDALIPAGEKTNAKPGGMGGA